MWFIRIPALHGWVITMLLFKVQQLPAFPQPCSQGLISAPVARWQVLIICKGKCASASRYLIPHYFVSYNIRTCQRRNLRQRCPENSAWINTWKGIVIQQISISHILCYTTLNDFVKRDSWMNKCTLCCTPNVINWYRFFVACSFACPSTIFHRMKCPPPLVWKVCDATGGP